MDPATISALAAWAAAIVTATSAGIQLSVGRKQADAAALSAKAALKHSESAGRHKVAEFRQAWINKVIDTLCEHHSILSTLPPGETPSSKDARELASTKTKLAILLNPDEEDTITLLNAIERVDGSKTDPEFERGEIEMLAVSRRLLKREWVRIKKELA
jgi:hypothetical protein